MFRGPVPSLINYCLTQSTCRGLDGTEVISRSAERNSRVHFDPPESPPRFEGSYGGPGVRSVWMSCGASLPSSVINRYRTRPT